MKAIQTITDIRQQAAALRSGGQSIGFVPTMGALHEGHLSLIEKARAAADAVIVSIYVNPKQFGPDEDFDDYPRTLQADVDTCKKAGVDAIFAPTDAIMYGHEPFINLQVKTLNAHMDGASRPGFFEGIVTVVNKLFNIIRPDVAVFGQKDIQQFRILQQMVVEFNHPTELVMAPIVRAADGLALSSRNAYLSDDERAQAPALYRSLQYLKQQITDGAQQLDLLLDHQKKELEAKNLQIDYLNVFDFERMKPVTHPQPGQTCVLAGAVYAGKTRLIDNVIVEVDD